MAWNRVICVRMMKFTLNAAQMMVVICFHCCFIVACLSCPVSMLKHKWLWPLLMLVQVDILYLRVELCSNVQVTIIRRHVSPYTLIFVNVIHWQWRDWQYWKVYDDIYLSLKLIQIWKNVSGYLLSSNVIAVIQMIKPCALMVKK